MPLGGVLFITGFIFIFGILLLLLANWFGYKVRTLSSVKMEPYECGIPGIEQKDTKVSVKYYLTAILFILFDIEIIFMYPWALTYGDFIKSSQGLFVLGSMGIFLIIFIYGLFWEIKSKALEWE